MYYLCGVIVRQLVTLNIMQAKPRFETYKILEQYSLLRDDTGNEMCLTLLDVKLPDNEREIAETPYKLWTVIGKNPYQWSNKAISYESCAFWKAQQKENLFKQAVNGFLIEEFQNGGHLVFNDKIWGLKTSFKIKRV